MVKLGIKMIKSTHTVPNSPNLISECNYLVFIKIKYKNIAIFSCNMLQRITK